MIKKELLSESPESLKYIILNIAAQMCILAANIALVFVLSYFIMMVSQGRHMARADILTRTGVIVICAILRLGCTEAMAYTSHMAAAGAKKKLRGKVFEKLTRLGASYHQKVSTSEIIQVTVEGIDQLETYFGRYLPQFFYAVLAPLCLFAVVAPISLKSALVLFFCVPLIPVAIVFVQKLAKNLLNRYWGKYTQLGDTFLENMQGLTALKIYGADEEKHRDMNEKAQEFRFITMKVLTMQLNSIIIMDIIAYGGAALGIILAVSETMSGSITAQEAFIIIMLSADFFLPMRTLGSYFHVAMNGMAASDKMFAILQIEEDKDGTEEVPSGHTVCGRGVSFSYDSERNVLEDVSFLIQEGTLTAVVGESGCGKTTLASLISGTQKGYSGSLKIGDKEIRTLQKDSLYRNITYVGAGSFIFAGTIRDNLKMGKPDAEDEELTEACRSAGIQEWIQTQQGLDTKIEADASNLSGGQKQRIALARALLHDTPIYIFDEATSNIDIESERDIMKAIYSFKGKKTVLLITHRLENAVKADHIYVLDSGKCVGDGKHEALLKDNDKYRELYTAQLEYERYAGKEEN